MLRVIQILMDAQTLALSRFAISPAVEVLGTVTGHRHHPRPHARRWYLRAVAGLPAATIELLHALIPADHPYSPDFLNPIPVVEHESIESMTERIAATPPGLVDYHLDVALRGRPVRAEVVEQFGSEGAYLAWRRPTPPALAALIERGPEQVAVEAAAAVHAFFRVGITPDWAATAALLEADVAFRGRQMAIRGARGLIEDLGHSLAWTGEGLVLQRPYDGVVDWAVNGLRFIPSSAQVRPEVQFSAEYPDDPLIIYTARGIAGLDTRDTRPSPALVNLLGETRATLFGLLSGPTCTQELSRASGWSTATVSYHLQALEASGLVSRTRVGRQVLYRRGPLGQELLMGGEACLSTGHEHGRSMNR